MAQVTLRILDGADRGRVFDGLGTPVTIGREEGNSVQLNDDRVSRFHLKIQEDNEQLVLTDLESTNGTKVNGEDIQLRILRHGDMICLGRSVLLFGSPDEIQGRLATLRGDQVKLVETDSRDDGASSSSNAGFDLNWPEEDDLQATIHIAEPPELPYRLSPAQAAQLSELLEYLHIRIRYLLACVRTTPDEERVTLDAKQWQNLLDLQARLAIYLRSIGEPGDGEE
jgi:pSer/pThr/pTyr-binding forkhead associated (FHA) protein